MFSPKETASLITSLVGLARKKTRLYCDVHRVEARAAAMIGLGAGVSSGTCRGENGERRFILGPSLSLLIGIGGGLAYQREQRIYDANDRHISSPSVYDPWFYRNALLGPGVISEFEGPWKEKVHGGGVGVGYFGSANFGIHGRGIRVGWDYNYLHSVLIGQE